MKKTVNWILAVALIVFAVDWGILGVHLLSGNYDTVVYACIGLGCLAVTVLCNLYRIFANRCPHCGKIRWVNGSYCAYCGICLEEAAQK